MDIMWTLKIYSLFLKLNLSFRLQNISEMNCFVKAFCFLTNHVPFDDITYPVSSKAFNFVEKYRKQIRDMKHKTEEHNYDGGLELDLEEQPLKKDSPADEMLPCLLLMAGSGVGILKVITCHF